jgi:hypothetical protein
MEAIETKRIGKYEIEIIPDSNPESPREWDNLGTMVCQHRRYNLGDKHDYDLNDCNSWLDVQKELGYPPIILNLYLYDHSGITMSCKPFGDKWDSGQVGFIFATNETLVKEYGRVDEEVINKAQSVLEGEVKTYDQYLTGDVYGYKIYELSTCDHGHEHMEEVDSCWGYYGEDSCMEEAESIVNSLIKHDQDVEQTRYP